MKIQKEALLKEGFFFINIAIISLALCSCSILEPYLTPSDPYLNVLSTYQEFGAEDYVQHLNYISREYLNTKKTKTIALTNDDRLYLERLYNKIILSNEVLLDSKFIPEFFIVKSKSPFYFSLPGAKFYFSTELIKNYVKSEDWLVALITTEAIKSHRLLYEKKAVVPLGFIGVERILSFTQLPLSISKQINKWAFYSLVRSGYDGSALLNWIQVQNRNSFDFTLQFGDNRRMSQEEQYVRILIAGEASGDGPSSSEIEENSSVYFYKLIKTVKKARL